MKRILSMMVCALMWCVAALGQANDGNEMLKNNRVWKFQETLVCLNTDPDADCWQYTVERKYSVAVRGEKEFGGKMCKVMHKVYDNSGLEERLHGVDWSFLMYEEDGRIYKIYEATGEIRPLLDFNMKVGDKFMNGALQVVDEDAVRIGDKMRRRLYIGDSDMVYDCWVEGLGSLNRYYITPEEMPTCDYYPINIKLTAVCDEKHNDIIGTYYEAVYDGRLFDLPYDAHGMEGEEWTLLTKKKGCDDAVLEWNFAELKKGANGRTYFQVFEGEDGILNPNRGQGTATNIGYRRTDKQVIVYDFEANKETVAFDFTLNAGSHWTTPNGMEWVVNEATMGENTRRKLKVHTKDGAMTDEWIEGIGSTQYHLLTTDISNTECANMLMYNFTRWQPWQYVTFNFDRDPIYGGYLGVLPHHIAGTSEQGATYSQDGILDAHITVETFPYYFFYYAQRKGNDVYANFYAIDNGMDCTSEACDLGITMHRVPHPTASTYTVHFNGKVLPQEHTVAAKNIASGIADAPTHNSTPSAFFDLQGRKLSNAPLKGIYIHNGKKMAR